MLPNIFYLVWPASAAAQGADAVRMQALWLHPQRHLLISTAMPTVSSWASLHCMS